MFASTADAKHHQHINPKRERTVLILNHGLSGTPMSGTGRELEAAGWKHGVHPGFIAAIAATESSLGRAACRNAPKNAFGLSSCGSGWRVPYFPTWSSVYSFMGRFLSERWPHARSTYDFHGYAADSYKWGRKTAYWMMRLFGLSSNVRYGR